MKLRITIIHDETCELYAAHQFTDEAALNSLKGMALVAQASWSGEADGGTHIDCPDLPVFDLLRSIIDAVEEKEVRS